MKNVKWIYAALIALLIVIVVGVFLFMKSREEKPVQEAPKYTEITFLPNLNKQSFEEKRNNGEEFAVLVWRPDCGDSQKFIGEFLNYFAEYNTDKTFARLKYNLGNENFYSFDISEFITQIRDTDTRKQYRDEYGFYFTPSLVYYKDLNNDGVSDVANIAEWDPVYGFTTGDYMKWFYDNGLIMPNVQVYHEGQTDKQD